MSKPFDIAKHAEAVFTGPALPPVTPRLCKGGCGEEVDRFDLCSSCYRDIKGPFSYGDDGDDE